MLGGIGSALEATVVIYVDGGLNEALQVLGDELRFVFISSAASVRPLADAPTDAVQGNGFRVSVGASELKKCVRCWHRREDVGSVAEHADICGRCVSNVDGPGEQRLFA